MNWDSIESNLDQFNGGVQEQLGMLTDHQLESVVSRRDERFGNIQQSFEIDDFDAAVDPDDFEIETDELPASMQ
jgi:uncharacterized protein YjbJ (UPF0337 family)